MHVFTFDHSVKGGSPKGSSVTDVEDEGMVKDGGGGILVVFVDSLVDPRLTNLLRANVPIVVSPLSINV